MATANFASARENMILLEDLHSIVLNATEKNPNVRHTLARLCLLDQERTLTLMEIITSLTKPGDVAIDLGAGTGILGFAFLNAGGEMLYAVEENPGLAKHMEDVAKTLGYWGRVSIHVADACKFASPRNADVVISEMIETGLLAESSFYAMGNARRHINQGARFIPQTAVSGVTLYDGKQSLSATRTYDEVDFMASTDNFVDKSLDFTIENSGFLKYARIHTELIFPNGQTTEHIGRFCHPFNIRLRILDARSQSRAYSGYSDLFGPKVLPGDKVTLRIKYTYGNNVKNFFATIKD